MWSGTNLAAFVALLTTVLPGACQNIEDNDVPELPQDTICGNIISQGEKGNPWFWASDVYECLTSVPFNSAVATRFLKYYNETIQFHSTIDLLRSPPASYRQAPVDFLQGLAQIQAKVEAEDYHNQYAFEHELQSLVQSVHDAHFVLYAGVLNQFTFGSNYEILSLSEDGHKAPEVYVRDDELLECIAQPGCTPSPVGSMNGVAVVEFLTDFAVNQSFGLVEPHADWNSLVMTPALEIQGGLTTFGGAATLYPGDELRITLKNGSDTYDNYFVSLYNSPGYTGPLTTGGDFYNYFVLGLTPASYDPTAYFASLDDSSSDDDTTASTQTRTHWDNDAYPNNTLVHERDLGSSGTMTGYLFDDISTAVLSILSFDSDVDSFSGVIVKFLERAADADKVIIDLQQNTGGQVALALEAYRQFFPSMIPFTGSRMRAHSAADAIGQTYNSYFDALSPDDDDYEDIISSEWVVTDRINAQTGQNFTSWAEYFGPRRVNGNLFTLTQQYNLSSPLFNENNLAIDWPSDVFNTSAPKESFPWAAKDIVILTDGLCSSACSYFVELMTQQTGVRTVVVGGRPEPGHMQAASGSRGAAAYSSDLLDADMNSTSSANATAQALLPFRDDDTDTGMVINYAGINLRDQIEANATLPNQMRYLPADCRIYWTFANFNNYTRLWHDVYTATYKDNTLCVPGSTNATDSFISKRNPKPASINTATTHNGDSDLSSYILTGIDGLPFGAGVENGPVVNPASFPALCGKTAPDQTICNAKQSGTRCMPISVGCNTCTTSRAGGSKCAPSAIKEFRCLRTCNAGLEGRSTGTCGFETTCPTGAQRNSKVNSSGSGGGRSSGRERISTSSYCFPKAPITVQSCSSLEKQWSRYNSEGASAGSTVPAQRSAARPPAV